MDSNNFTAEKMKIGANAAGRRKTVIVYGIKVQREKSSSPPPKIKKEDLGVDASMKMEINDPVEFPRDGSEIEVLDISDDDEEEVVKPIEFIDLCESDAEDEEMPPVDPPRPEYFEVPPVKPVAVFDPQPEYFVIKEEDSSDEEIGDIKIETLTQPFRPPTPPRVEEVTSSEDQRQSILDKLNLTQSRCAIKSSNFSTHRSLQSVHESHGADSTVPPTLPMPPNSPAISEEFEFPTSSSGTLFTPIVRGKELLSADPSTSTSSSSVYVPLEEVQGKDLGRLHWVESQYAPVGCQDPEENVYVVQDIRDVRFQEEKQYKVKWMGWSHEFNSWINASELKITTGFPFLPKRQNTIDGKNDLKQEYF